MYTVYTGERVRIRPYKNVSEWEYVIADGNKDLNEHWGSWYWPLAEARKEFDKAGLLASDGYCSFAVERIDTGELVGSEDCGGMIAGKCSSWIGTGIIKKQRHKGFGIEAKLLCMTYLFENYPVLSIFADTTETHLPAQRGLEAAGMHRVGTRRKAHCYRGNYVDVVGYQILREEWEKLPIRKIVKRGA